MCASAHYEFSRQLGSVAWARNVVKIHIAAYLRPSELATETVERAALVVSELVTNAIKFGRPAGSVDVDVHLGYIWICVHDNGPGRPDMHRPQSDDTNGRGLVIVNAVSNSWGFTPGDIGKDVWAKLSYPINLAPALSCSFATN